MKKTTRNNRRGRVSTRRSAVRVKRTENLASRAYSVVKSALHFRPAAERPWKHLPWILLLAFAFRVAIAISGDYVLHPDEVMQYLEPAHQLVFGNGVTYWEYFYGARSWLVPGLVAGVLLFFKTVGLDSPEWYVGSVKVLFCFISLAVPAGMYFFTRRHMGESTARVALVAGAFWYELAGFAHKPMTEFVATAVIMTMLAVFAKSPSGRPGVTWLVVFLGVLTSAIRMQYLPLVLFLFLVFVLLAKRKIHFVLAAVLSVVGIGVFDALTWQGGLFHSYILNLQVNLALDAFRSGESPSYQFVTWLFVSGVGLSALSIVLALRDFRRYGFLLALLAIVLVSHSLQAHKEYRFIFIAIPIWLIIGADVLARFAIRKDRRLWGVGAACFATISLCGIGNLLPYQNDVYTYRAQSKSTVYFVTNQDPTFDAYRYLASAEGVKSVWQPDKRYYELPGYYYLHRKIPFFDSGTGRMVNADLETLQSTVSHIVSSIPDFAIAGYSLEREFGDVRVLKRDENETPVQDWVTYTPTIIYEMKEIVEEIDPGAPSPPANDGIRFTTEAVNNKQEE